MIKKFLEGIEGMWAKLSNREHLITLLLVICVTPFFRGGRDSLGLLAIGLALFFAALFMRPYGQLSLYIKSKKTILSILVVLAWVWLSLIWSSDRSAGFTSAVTLSYVAIFSVLLSNFLRGNNRRIRGFIYYSVSASIVMSGVAVWMYLTIPFDRATGLFFWANPLALYLSTHIILLLFLILKRPNLSGLLYAMLLLLTTTFILTESLATFSFSILAITVYLLLNRKTAKFHLGPLVITLLLSLVVSNGLTYSKGEYFEAKGLGGQDTLLELATQKASGLDDRYKYWDSSLDMIIDNPLVGRGSGSFSIEYPSYQQDVSSGVTNPHNAVLNFAVQYGAFTALAAIFMLISFFFKNVVASGRLSVFSILFLLALAHSSFYQTDRYPTLLLLVAAMGVLMSASQKKASSSMRVSIPVVMLTMAMVFSSFFIFRERVLVFEASYSASTFNVDRAIDLYQKAADVPFGNVDSLAILGWQQYLSGDSVSALNNITSAIDSDSKDSQHYFLRSFVLKQAGRSGLAEIDLRKSLELDPINQPRAYSLLADILISEGRLKEARKLITAALPFYKESEVKRRRSTGSIYEDVGLIYFQKAKLELISNNRQAANKALDKTLQFRPLYEPALLLRGGSLIQ